jgi:hypothetical protein
MPDGVVAFSYLGGLKIYIALFAFYCQKVCALPFETGRPLVLILEE